MLTRKSGTAASKSLRNRNGSRLALRASRPTATPAAKLTETESHALIESHYEAARRLAWSFLNRWHARLEEDEVLSITGSALVEAAGRFNPSLNVSFNTFLFYYLRGMLLKEISRRVKEQRRSIPTDALGCGFAVQKDDSTAPVWHTVFVETTTPEDLVDREQLRAAFRRACAKLDPLEEDVLMRFFLEGQSVIEIAAELGYCRCHISRVKSRATDLVKSELASLMQSHSGESSSGQGSRQRNRYSGGRGRRRSYLSERDADMPERQAVGQ